MRPQIAAINGSVIDSTRYQRPWSYRADLHECSSSKVCSGWSSDSVIDVTVCTKSRYRSNLVSQEFSERDRARLKYSTWQRLLSRCGFNLGLAVCACAAASHTYVLNKLAGNNTLIIMTSLISTALLLVKWSWFRECCLSSLKVAYARDWLQFAKSILSAESARSLGLRLQLRDYSSSALTLSEFQLERLSQSTLVDLCKTWGIGISYSLSMLSLANSHYKILCHGCAKLVQAVEHEQALLFLEWTGWLHQETCPCLHITTCQRLCTRPCICR